MKDYRSLLAELAKAYRAHSPRSAALQERAEAVMVDGGSHTLRLLHPFPPRIVRAQGAWIEDEDGHRLLDFWQGHLGNLLGHNPEIVTSALAQALHQPWGLQTGFTDALQIETAEVFCRQTGSERVRFTTSGTLATMYAIFLARAHTGRRLVMKVGGGWHGAQPWALKGVDFHANGETGFSSIESDGVPESVAGQVLLTGFNDPERLRADFVQWGDQLAAFILEPFLGAGGHIPASREYLHAARELTDRYGVVMILDEVISGFRFRAGNLSALYGIQPDLATYGKIMGGGMPVSAVGGRAEIMELSGRKGGDRVKFSGGTYSAHPASMLAAKAMMTYLSEHEAEVYPRLARLGALTRQTLVEALAAEGVQAITTGSDAESLPDSPMFMVHFPLQAGVRADRPEDLANPALFDTALSRQVLNLALLLEDVFLIKGHGTLTLAHTEADIQILADACRRAIRRAGRRLR